MRRPSIAALFTPELRRTTIVTTLMFAFAYGAAFGAIQQMPRIVPGIEEVRVLPPPQIQQTASQVQAYQEFGGLAGRFLLAVLALYIVSRRKLIRAFQIPGLFVMPFVFYYAPTHSLELTKWGMFFAGVFTVGQLSFWGNYLPRVYPTHLRGTGEGFAANIGGRMLGTSFAFVTTTLANYAPGRHAVVAAGVCGHGGRDIRLHRPASSAASSCQSRRATRFRNRHACHSCAALLTAPLPVRAEQPVLSEIGAGNSAARIESKQWPQFRGPGSTGVAEGANLPDTWSTTQNVKWKTAIPGHGWSSPIAWGDRIFVTSVIPVGETEAPKRGLYLQGERPAPTIEHRYMVYAIDFATGKIAWEREVHRGVPPGARHLKNTFASETPVTDGTRVYAAFGNVGIFAFDFSGKPLWSLSDAREADAQRLGHRVVAGPARRAPVFRQRQRRGLVAGRGRCRDGQDGLASLIVQKKRTGRRRIIWRTCGPHRDRHQRHERDSLLRSRRQAALAARPIVDASSSRRRSPQFDLLYASSGYVGDSKRPVYAIRPGGRGDISLKAGETSNASIAWSLPQGGTYNVSPIVYGDYFYTLFDRGFFTCHDAKTGKEIYTKVRLDPTASGFTASPWAYNGKIFAMSEDGTTYVIQAGPEFKVIGQNVLDEFTMASPAIHQNSLLIRTATSLYRIGNPQ